MAKLTSSEVLHVAKLAKLSLTKDEIQTYGDQLSSIVSYVEQLKEVDTSGVEPTSQTTGLTNVFRSDEIDATRILPVEDALNGTDNTHNSYFLVPLVLKHKQS